MKHLVILGGGTGGTIMANKLSPKLDNSEWKITLVDKNETHYYQPGFLFIPFGIYSKDDVVKPKRTFIPKRVDVVFSGIEKIDPDTSSVFLENKSTLSYDLLIIATGTDIRPDEIEGMTGKEWQKSILTSTPLMVPSSSKSSFLHGREAN
jgi:sulfide:quinone oxidoreductase